MVKQKLYNSAFTGKNLKNYVRYKNKRARPFE